MATQEDFNTRFDQMGREIDGMVADDREDLREERIALKDKWNRLDSRRMEIKNEGEGAWDKFKDEMDGAWGDIKTSFDDVKNRFAR